MSVIAGAAHTRISLGRSAHSSRVLTVGLWVLLSAATLLPVLVVPVPNLVDYPNHLARSWILVHASDIPQLAANYQVHWRLIADLAMDLVVPTLSRFMPVLVAGKLFILLIMLSLIAGTATLHRTLWGRVGLWPLCSLLMVYNAILFWGFLDCLCGTGVFLFVFSGWIASRRWPLPARMALSSLAACVLLLLHLFAFGLYALTIGAYEFGLWWRRRSFRGFWTMCLIGTQFVPGMVLWYLAAQNGERSLTEYGGWVSKIYAIISPVTFAEKPVVLDWIFVLFVAVFLIFASTRRWFRIHPEMRFPLIVLLATAVAMPNWLSGSWLADIRMPVALGFIAVASSELRIPAFRIRAGLALVAAALLGLRVLGTAELWRDFNHNLDEFSQAAKAMPLGSRMLVVRRGGARLSAKAPGVPFWMAQRERDAYTHLPAFAVIERAAFFPYLFTLWKTVEVAPRDRALADGGVGSVPPQVLLDVVNHVPASDPLLAKTMHDHFRRDYWTNWPQRFDYVLWIDFAKRFPAQFPHLSLVDDGSFFRLYQVTR